MFHPGDKIRPWLSFLLAFGHFVAIFMLAKLNVFSSGKLTMISRTGMKFERLMLNTFASP